MGTEDQQQALLGALEALGGSAGNGKLRELLGWDEATLEAVKAPLVTSGRLRAGRGRGGSLSLVDGTSVLGGGGADREEAASPQAPQPSGKQSLSAFIWGVADLLRGDYKQSDYGKVILPFTVLRRLDCVLEPTKDAVLAEKERRQAQGLDPEPFLLRVAGQNFCNTSALTMKRLLGDQDNIGENLRSYLQAFTPEVR
ncbi:MAG: type I restriction-modification system subunit M N-terminal domain-containing protein, partial [Cyanobacteriota bacterium]|nr:type I restriction-modification system subunit M N-terminal domain-containing protein [Cyanobacteriota bacterium]